MNKLRQRNEMLSTIKDIMLSNMNHSIDGGYSELDDYDIDNISSEIADTLILDYCSINEAEDKLKWRDAEIKALQEDFQNLARQNETLESYISEIPEYGYVDGDKTGTDDGIVEIIYGDKAKRLSRIARYDKFLSLNDCLKEVGYNPLLGGTVTVIIDTALRGDVYIYGNYEKGRWYKYGETKGFA